MSDFFTAIFGAGLSGLSAANALSKKGKKVLLIDPYVSDDAQGAPAAMVNPAAGKRAKMSWKSMECLSALNAHLKELSESAGRDDLYLASGVLRPAITEELAELFRESLQKYNWPDGWISWIDENEAREYNPDIAPCRGALFLKNGMTVFVDKYLNCYRKFLRQRGVVIRYERHSYTLENSRFTLKNEKGETCTADHVIIAAGPETPGFEEWSGLPLHLVKGQIVLFRADRDLEWDCGISAMGYALRRGKRELIVGSTYEHHFEDLNITQDAYWRIAVKLEMMLPGLAGRVEKIDQLAGIRVTTPNNLPVIGRHRQIENLCIYTGMGSKGLLFSEYTGSLLADHLADGAAIPEELDARRFG